MYVRMVLKILSPGVEHAQKADIGTEMFRIGRASGDTQNRPPVDT